MGIAAGGPAGAIGGAITAISGVAEAVVKGAGGASPSVALEWMYAELDNATSTMDKDRGQLGAAIGECEATFFGRMGPRSLLPPEVGLATV